MDEAKKESAVGTGYKLEVVADVAGGFLRLAFHDAAGYDQNTDDGLGPDGCFVHPENGDNPNKGNAGLPSVAG